MFDIFLGWVHGFGTVSGLARFLVGFGAAFLLRYLWCKYKQPDTTIAWPYIGIVVGVLVILWSSFQSQQAYTLAQQTALEVRDCQREFNSALQARVKITSENDELSQTQRRIVFNWIHDLIFPPEPYAGMDPNDPRRQQFGIALTIKTEHEFQASLNRQDELQKQRDQHPLPDPTCGHA